MKEVATLLTNYIATAVWYFNSLYKSWKNKSSAYTFLHFNLYILFYDIRLYL